MIKKLIYTLYIIILASMAAATIVEKNHGTDYAHQTIYGAWWFPALWGILAATGLFYILRRKATASLPVHLSLAVILAGALITHVFSVKGMIHLRTGELTNTYISEKKLKLLPFSIRLNKFETSYHAGTGAAADYMSAFTISDGSKQIQGKVSMNHIFAYRSHRFYQASYDEDGNGSILAVNTDPYGIPVTYTGYAMLFLSLLWMLVDPKGSYRRLLRHPMLKKGTMLTALLLSCNLSTHALSSLPENTAEKFGQLHILYNGRICLVETYALDFCKKMYGAGSYGGMTAEQVLTGWIFYGNEWEMDWIQNHQHSTGSDLKYKLAMEVRSGTTLRMLPYTESHTVWYAPTGRLPQTMERQHARYIANVFSLIYADIRSRNFTRAEEFLDKMKLYQKSNAGNTLPTKAQYLAERLYNRIPFATVLFIVNLALGLVALCHTICLLTWHRGIRFMDYAMPALLFMSFLSLSFVLSLRWIISGSIPLTNGYETMLVLAWLIQLIALCLHRRLPVLLVFGFLLPGFFLLVSHLNLIDPAIGHIMPVLNSPLLSLHVSIIMMSYALLSLTFICALMAFCLRNRAKEMQVLSQLFLYPAIAALATGIFIGAIWANVSWGAYWSWDSKETWALITFMLYAVALHTKSLPIFNRPMAYHTYMLLAFLSLAMTYFGVNYFLTGMHSYA